MTNVDIVGCRRRSAYDFQEQLGKKMDFRCKGREGPPCFLKLGDIGDFRATFHTGRDNEGYMFIATIISYRPNV